MKLLVVIDMQKDFVNMALGTPEAQAIVPNVVRLIKEAKKDIIITTYDTHGNDYMETLEGKKLPVPHCLTGTDGWFLDDQVRAALEEVPHECENDILGYWIEVTKPTFGFLGWKEILNAHPEIDEIVICGLCTDICVISNALILRAIVPNMKITLVKNACAGVTPEKHEAALKVAESCQIDVVDM